MIFSFSRYNAYKVWNLSSYWGNRDVSVIDQQHQLTPNWSVMVIFQKARKKILQKINEQDNDVLDILGANTGI